MSKNKKQKKEEKITRSDKSELSKSNKLKTETRHGICIDVILRHGGCSWKNNL
jgi:hypothetical protein